MEIIDLIGAFAYPATVRTRYGHSKRLNLLGRMKYEIVSVNSSEVDRGAVVAAPPDSGCDRVSFTGWNGRLWRPLSGWMDHTPFTSPNISPAWVDMAVTTRPYTKPATRWTTSMMVGCLRIHANVSLRRTIS